jgi:hypothetical protein
MLIESPRWTSSRIGPTSVIVAENPLPPELVVSSAVSADITPRCSTAVRKEKEISTYPGEHGM